jgi:hypothetical protein
MLKYQFSSFHLIHFVFPRNAVTNEMDGSLTDYKIFFGKSACCIMERNIPVSLMKSCCLQRIEQITVWTFVGTYQTLILVGLPEILEGYSYCFLSDSSEQCWGHIRWRVSKQNKNRSKTAVMDVIAFLCVSPGSSTIQLRDSLGSRRACACSEAGFSRQNGDRARGVYYLRASFWCALFVGKRTQFKRYS